jgi:hypothetical protein
MKLTEMEKRQIRKLRKDEQNWKYTRWILVGGSMFVIVVYASVFWLCFQTVRTDLKTSDIVALLMFILPQVLFALSLSFAALLIAIRDWSGNVKRRLILKLFEYYEQTSSSN